MRLRNRILGVGLLGLAALLAAPGQGQAHRAWYGHGYYGRGYYAPVVPYAYAYHPVPPPVVYRSWYPPAYYAYGPGHYRHWHHHHHGRWWR